MKGLTFRSSRIIYYGPHPCINCGVLIAKMGNEFGGNAFTYPEGPIYPNTKWNPHVCDPKHISTLPTNSVSSVEPKQPREDRIRHMVDRFLGWQFPENFSPDGGISFKKTSSPLPIGTNLLDADQAGQMVRYMLEGLE